MPLTIARLTEADAPAYRTLMLQAYEVPDAFTSTPQERAAAPAGFWTERVAHAQAGGQARVLNLTVTEGNAAALALYQRAGFQAFGTEPMAVQTPDGFKAKVHMWMPVPVQGRGNEI